MDNSFEYNLNSPYLEPFLQNEKNLIQIINDNSINNNKNIIRNLIGQNKEDKKINDYLCLKSFDSEKFMENYISNLTHLSQKDNIFPPLLNINRLEVELLQLIHTMHLSDLKIEKYKNENNLNQNQCLNHLTKINNIIKKSPELIGYVFLLKWLKKKFKNDYVDFNKDLKLKELIENEEIIEENKENDKNDPIYIERKCSSNKKEDEQYQKLMEQFKYKLLIENISDAQKFCEKKCIEEFGKLFGGGCPLYDYEKEKDINNFDEDLISPSFYSMSYKHFLDFKKSKTEPEKAFSIDEKIRNNLYYGNSLYLIWFKEMYEDADLTKDNHNLNILFRLVSGNSKDYELTIDNVYEYLYLNILNLLNSKIFFELTKNPNNYFPQLDYIEPEAFGEISDVYKSENNNIFCIINKIKESELYRNIYNKYLNIDCEMEFINWYFSKLKISKDPTKSENENSLISLFTPLFNKIVSLCTQINDEEPDKINYLNLSSPDNKDLVQILKVCNGRLKFNVINLFFSTNLHFFNKINKIELEKRTGIIEGFFDKFDIEYSNYIIEFIKLSNKINIDITVPVYICNYMFNINHIFDLLIYCYQNIKREVNNTGEQAEISNKLFKEIKKEIKLETHGFSLADFLCQKIVKNPEVNCINKRFKSIDDYVAHYSEIKERKQNLKDYNTTLLENLKILFGKNPNNNQEINESTKFNIIIKYLIQSLSQYEFILANDCYLEFCSEWKTSFDKCIDSHQKFCPSKAIKTIKTIKESKDNSLCIEASIYLIKTILRCFFDYFDNEIKSMVLCNNLLSLSKFIKLILSNDEILQDLRNYYINDFKCIEQICGDWGYQIIKWISEIYLINKSNNSNNPNNISLSDILEACIYDESMLKLNYFDNIIVHSLFKENQKVSLINTENRLYSLISYEQRKDILKILYNIIKQSKNELKIIFDINYIEELKADINNTKNEITFDYDEEN